MFTVHVNRLPGYIVQSWANIAENDNFSASENMKMPTIIGESEIILTWFIKKKKILKSILYSIAFIQNIDV